MSSPLHPLSASPSLASPLPPAAHGTHTANRPHRDTHTADATLPPETLQRLGAFRRLLDQPEFTTDFLQGLEQERRADLAALPDNATEPALRRAFLRWKQSLEIGADVASFVTAVETQLAGGAERGVGSTL